MTRKAKRSVLRLVATLLLTMAGQTARGQDRVAGARAIVTYHADAARSGNYLMPGLTWARAATVHRDFGFAGTVSGPVVAQPLYWHPSGRAHGLIIVATETNVVSALDARSGREVWRIELGTPATRLACGGPGPVGITGTPVIDPADDALYVDALVSGHDGPRHLVFGLSLTDGAVLPGWPVPVTKPADGADFVAGMQNQRGALALVGRRLIVPYGSFQDCGVYRGWVVALDLDLPRVITTWVTRGQKGGIWAPGGVLSDGAGVVFATGNTEPAAAWNDGEAVFHLGPELRRTSDPRDYFVPDDWPTLNADDADLAGTNPVFVDLAGPEGPRRFVMAFGKNGRAYVLDRDNLGGIGGALLVRQVSDGPIITSAAIYPGAGGTFVAVHAHAPTCPENLADPGLTVLRLTAGPPLDLQVAWCGTVEGAGAPIVTTLDGRGAEPVVWIVGADGDGRLHGFRGDTGQVLFDGGDKADAMTGLRRFATILAAEDRLYVAGDDRVYAFTFAPTAAISSAAAR